MFRFVLLIAMLVSPWFVTAAEARGPWFRNLFRGPRVQRTVPPVTNHPQSEPTLFGMGIGVGSYPPYNYPRPGEFNPYRFDSYIYDPYVSGSFEPPDLLNDPYFRERHRYDSHFPGRRYRNKK